MDHEPETIGKVFHGTVSEEITTMELFARSSYEHPDMPDDFHADMARQAADESRHASACLEVLAGLGIPFGTVMDAEVTSLEVTYEVGQKLAFLGESEVIRISALTGKNVHRLLPALAEAIQAYHRRVPTRKVNEVVSLAQSAQPAPHGARILYATQGAADPPTFTLFANKELPATYLRYIERKLRDAFDLGATPIKLRVRQRSN
jgi:hypothetical protein